MIRRILLVLLLIFPQILASADETEPAPVVPGSGNGDRGPGMDPWG